MNTAQSGGLVGLYQRIRSGAGHIFESALVRFFAFCVVGAAVIGIYQHVVEKATTPLDFWRLLLLGIGAITAEFLGVHKLVTNWHGARVGSMIAWTAIWAVGVTFAAYNVLSTGASFQAKRDGLQHTAFNAYGDARNDVEIKRAALKKAEKINEDTAKLTLTPLPTVDGKPVSSVAAADAIINSLKANTRFWDLTNGGKESAGKETRKFVMNYGEAVAAKADLEDRKSWDGKLAASLDALKTAKAEFIAAEVKANNTVAVTDEATPFVSLVAHISGKKATEVSWMEPLSSSLINMLLVSFAGIVSALSAIEGKPRTKFINWKPAQNVVKGCARWARGIVTGKSDLAMDLETARKSGVAVVHETHKETVVKDEGLLAALRAGAQKHAPHLMVA